MADSETSRDDGANVANILDYLRTASPETFGDGKDVFDALAAALAVERLDPIMMRIRGRANVMKLLAQLSRATELVTGIAEHLGLEYDGSPVVQDDNFGSWNTTRSTQLAALIKSRVDAIKARADEQEAVYAQSEARHAADSARIEQQTDQINRERSESEARVALHLESAQRALAMLSAYVDVPRYVVARIDPTTKKVVALLREEEDLLRQVSSVDKATRFGDFGEANDLRLEAIRAKRAKVARPARAVVANQYAVMQLALRSVDFETVVDESPEEEDAD